MKEVAEGVGVNRAAMDFGVPKTTLKDRVSGKVQHGCKPGKVHYVTSNEEKEFYEYMVTSARPKKKDEEIVHKTLAK